MLSGFTLPTLVQTSLRAFLVLPMNDRGVGTNVGAPSTQCINVDDPSVSLVEHENTTNKPGDGRDDALCNQKAPPESQCHSNNMSKNDVQVSVLVEGKTLAQATATNPQQFFQRESPRDSRPLVASAAGALTNPRVPPNHFEKLVDHGNKPDDAPSASFASSVITSSERERFPRSSSSRARTAQEDAHAHNARRNRIVARKDVSQPPAPINQGCSIPSSISVASVTSTSSLLSAPSSGHRQGRQNVLSRDNSKSSTKRGVLDVTTDVSISKRQKTALEYVGTEETQDESEATLAAAEETHSTTEGQSVADGEQRVKDKSANAKKGAASTDGQTEDASETEDAAEADEGLFSKSLDIGTRVYAKWRENGEWYWGEIKSRFKIHEKYVYSVKFDDGDLQHRTSRKDVVDENEYVQAPPIKSPPPPSEVDSNESNSSIPAVHWWSDRCMTCHNCKKEPCGRCAACREAKSGDSHSPKMCFQKWCYNLDPNMAGLPAPWENPPGWKFYFRGPDRVDIYDGPLRVMLPNGTTYRSLEAAIARCKRKDVDAFNVDVYAFYDHVGLDRDYGLKLKQFARQRVESPKAEPPVFDVVPPTPDHARSASPGPADRCMVCYNCTKAPCGRCAACREPRRGGQQTPSICLQKTCCKLDPETAGHPAPWENPPGWKYVFKGQDRVDMYDGPLRLVAPNGRLFRSIEAATSFSMKEFAGIVVDIDAFYDHVGLDKDYGLRRKPGRPRTALLKAESTSSEDSLSEKIEGDLVIPSEGTSNDACMTCVNCAKEPCGRCAACREVKSGAGQKGKICFQKLCCKLVPIVGGHPAPWKNPSGWKFYFLGTDRKVPRDGPLRLVRPNGSIYRTLEAATNRCTKEFPTLVDFDGFYDFVGLDRDYGRRLGRPCLKLLNAGSNPPQEEDSKQRALSSILQKGSRCYAEYINDEMYWGWITDVTEGNILKYSVLFEDLDFIDNVGPDQIMTELDYKKLYEHPPEPPFSFEYALAHYQKKGRIKTNGCSEDLATQQLSQNEPLKLKDLRHRRCRKCTMCEKEDCGHCYSCKSNNERTSLYKEACLFNICETFSVQEKAQKIRKLQLDVRFYFESPSRRLAPQGYLLPDLNGLCIFVPKDDGQGPAYRYHSLESALERREFTRTEFQAVSEDFYSNQLGLSMQVERNHELLGHRIRREWSSGKGKKVIVGKVAKCKEALLSKALRFEIHYEENTRRMVNNLPGFGIVPAVGENWSEAFIRHKWIVPDSRVETNILMDYDQSSADKPAMSLIVGEFLLVLQVKPSLIPGAGLGVFLRCVRPGFPNDVRAFELKAYEYVDLGVYAPLRAEDVKSEHVFSIKNFLYHDECESWSFNALCPRTKSVLDITKDETGGLHELARRNVLSYVNETNGIESATVRAEHDPEGAVHYLLGPDTDDGKVFRLQVNKEIELKIDYGPNYEKVRVCKGYSRLNATAQEEMRKSYARGENDLLYDVRDWTADEVVQGLEFLEALVNYNNKNNNNLDTTTTTSDRATRCLILSIAMLTRLHSILDEFKHIDLDRDDISFCDNGYSALDRDKAWQRAQALVDGFLGHWTDHNQLNADIKSQKAYRVILDRALDKVLGIKSSDATTPVKVRNRIRKLCQAPMPST